jgi:signal transduction histidine kinase
MPIRLRIVLATAVIMALSLASLGVGMYFTMSRSLHNDVDARLQAVFSGYQQNPGDWVLEGGRFGLRPDPNPFAFTGAYIQIMDGTGTVRARSQNLGDETLPVERSVLIQNFTHDAVYYDADVNGRPVRILSDRVALGANDLVVFVQVAEPLEPVQTTLGTLRRNMIVGSIMSTLVLALGAWLVGDAAMRPLARMSVTARMIGRTGDLSRRLQPPRTKDEAQHLAETFNEMLARLEETFNAQRRFVADASHELRTPLTALRANADIMLRQIDSGLVDRVDLTDGLTDVRDEVDRMSRLVQNLLTLARADVGWRPELEPVDLIEVARDAARIAAPLPRGQQFELELPPPEPGGETRPVDVLGNADQLRQLILILLDNAFTYAPPESQVRLIVETGADAAVLSVHDNGPGIAPDQLRRIFERFYRTDDARSRASGGTGLGLAIARWIVAVHDGEITVDSARDRGTRFSVRLPLLPSDYEASKARVQMSTTATVA